MFSIQIENLAEVEKAFAWAEAQLATGFERAVTIACNEGANEARLTHRYQDRTGNLTRSILGRLTGQVRGGGKGEVVATVPYASFVENGTRPHEIWPKAATGSVGPLRAGQSRRSRAETRAIKDRNRVAGRGATVGRHMLAWQETAGDWHFARMVHHPGTKPYGFMGDAYLKTERALLRQVEMEIASVANLM